jgi:hypothetical protein
MYRSGISYEQYCQDGRVRYAWEERQDWYYEGFAWECIDDRYCWNWQWTGRDSTVCRREGTT